MYVRKFEADTLDEALKNVKKELGPEAIILKTITNKGLKGTLKKKRIEITAAITEENYLKKAKVDKVLDDEQKDQFYQNDATTVKKGIDSYNGISSSLSKNTQPATNSYGNLGLNRVVSTASKKAGEFGQKIKSGLDEFLSSDETDNLSLNNSLEEMNLEQSTPEWKMIPDSEEKVEIEQNHIVEENVYAQNYKAQNETIIQLRRELKEQNNKLELLEKKLFDLGQNVFLHKKETNEKKGLEVVNFNLRSLGLDEKIIQEFNKNVIFDLSPNEQESEEDVYDYALSFLTKKINVKNSNLCDSHNDKGPISVYVSEVSSGQSLICLKSSIKNNANYVIQFNYGGEDKRAKSLGEHLYNKKYISCSSFGELMGLCRKLREKGEKVILDFKIGTANDEDVKKHLQVLKKSFENVEINLCLSSIHSKYYTKKIVEKYRGILNGIVVTFLDQCLNYSDLVNLSYQNPDLPFVSFSTGELIPEDFEAATPERLVAALFGIK